SLWCPTSMPSTRVMLPAGWARRAEKVDAFMPALWPSSAPWAAHANGPAPRWPSLGSETISPMSDLSENNPPAILPESAASLPPEWVSANVHRKKNNWESGTLTAVHRESSQRVTPGCPHFGLHDGACGGCKMQHLHVSAQVAVKQRVLEDNLWHLGKIKPETLLRPIEGPAWGYRYRSRLSVRYVIKKGKALVGFHERKSRYIADMETCKV